MNKKVMRHKVLCDELNELYERKNHDYGDSFHQTFIEEGFAMSRIRLADKFNRFKTLSKQADLTAQKHNLSYKTLVKGQKSHRRVHS